MPSQVIPGWVKPRQSALKGADSIISGVTVLHEPGTKAAAQVNEAKIKGNFCLEPDGPHLVRFIGQAEHGAHCLLVRETDNIVRGPATLW